VDHVDRNLEEVNQMQFNRKTCLSGMTLMAFLLAVGGLAAAQESGSKKAESDQADRSTQQKENRQTGQAAGQESKGPAGSLPDAYKISSWIGESVRNNAGDSLGTVNELVIDDTGRLRFVIMESELLAAEQPGNLIAVPIGHFVYRASPSKDESRLVLDASPGRLQGAPSFHSSAWPNMGDREWDAAIITYWVPVEALKQSTAGQADATGGGRGQDDQQTARTPDDRESRQAQGSRQSEGGQESARAGDSESQFFSANRDMIYLPEKKERLFDRLDANNDGAIDPDEAQAHSDLAEKFDRVDTYGNDRITRSEFAAFEIGESGQQQSQSQSQ
jgi:hypothetical protein